MVKTTDKPSYSNIFDAVPKVVEAIQSLFIDDQLGLLWVLYENMGGLVTPAAPGATERIKLAGGLIYEVGNLPHQEQLQLMRDLVGGVDNPLTRSYGLLSSNNKLAFWYQLAEWMRSGEVIPTPEGYKLSAPATAVLNRVVALEFNQQIAVLRLIVGKMGIDPLTV
ncbi:MAG: orange carotenoid protein N-terminal domain-containing protein [Calothrix sp. MO_192.B10]|nr:orange carotenoid protein N-terminal domain-containing protein [Calothrix sp. MO_192.B10]